MRSYAAVALVSLAVELYVCFLRDVPNQKYRPFENTTCVMPSTTFHVQFFGTWPLHPLLTNLTFLSLLVSSCELCWFEWLIVVLKCFSTMLIFDWGFEVLLLCRYCTYMYRTLGTVKCCSTETTVYRTYTYRTLGTVKCCSTETTVSQDKYWPTFQSPMADTRLQWVVPYCVLDCTVHLYTPGSSSDPNIQQYTVHSTAMHCWMKCIIVWPMACCHGHFPCIVTHSVHHTYFLSHFFPLFLCFSYQEARDKRCCVSHLSCLDGVITSSCLRASIECVRQSVL